MRNTALVLRSSCAALLLSVAGMCVPAQTPQANTAGVQEPQYANEYFEIGPDGSLIALETVKLNAEMKSHNHFISNSVSGFYVAPGAASTVRVPATAHFVIRVPPGYENVNPATVIMLKPFTVEKDKRTLPISTAKAGMFQGVKSQTAADNSIPLTFKKYGPNSLEIVPAQPLPPGEYELGMNGPEGVFCFGVDAK